jgi:hypothetical protein
MGAVTLLAVPDGPTQLAGATLGQTAQGLNLLSGQSVTLKVLGQEHL